MVSFFATCNQILLQPEQESQRDLVILLYIFTVLHGVGEY
jgi:hypothetical protein